MKSHTWFDPLVLTPFLPDVPSQWPGWSWATKQLRYYVRSCEVETFADIQGLWDISYSSRWGADWSSNSIVIWCKQGSGYRLPGDLLITSVRWTNADDFRRENLLMPGVDIRILGLSITDRERRAVIIVHGPKPQLAELAQREQVA